MRNWKREELRVPRWLKTAEIVLRSKLRRALVFYDQLDRKAPSVTMFNFIRNAKMSGNAWAVKTVVGQ